MTLSNQGRVEVASPCHVYGANPLTEDDATWIGARSKIVTANRKSLQGMESIIAAGGAQLGYYTKTSALASGTALPESGYAHKIGGARKYDQTWNVYTAQPDSDAWRAYHLKQLLSLPSWVQAVFSDSVLLSYSQGGKPAKPPGFTVNYTLPEWLAMEKTNLDQWASVNGLPFIVNGLARSSLAALSPCVGMIENAFGSQTGALPGSVAWLSTVQLIVDAQAAGWTPWAYVKLAASADRDAWRRLIVPTMLLVDNGSLLFELGGVEGSPQPWVTREYDHACYQPDIGAALGPMYSHTVGIYRRDFESGFVVVNMSTTPYVTIEEGVTVAPQTGTIAKAREVTTTIYDVVA